MMRNFFASMTVRIGIMFLLGLLLLPVVVVGAMLWPDGRPVIFRAMVERLP